MESREDDLLEAYVFGNTSVASRILEEAEREYVEKIKREFAVDDQN